MSGTSSKVVECSLLSCGHIVIDFDADGFAIEIEPDSAEELANTLLELVAESRKLKREKMS